MPILSSFTFSQSCLLDYADCTRRFQLLNVAQLDYARERLRLQYVGITLAKKELFTTWNTGRTGEQTQAIPFASLQGGTKQPARTPNDELAGAIGLLILVSHGRKNLTDQLIQLGVERFVQ